MDLPQQVEILKTLIIHWTNWSLRFREDVKTVKSLNAFVDGWTLPALLAELSPVQFNLKKVKKTKSKTTALKICLEFLEREKKLYLPDIDAKGLKSDPLKCTTLLVKVIFYYDIEEVLQPRPEYYLNRPNPKELLLTWVNQCLQSMDRPKITNFTSDWRDGQVLCALVNFLDPALCKDWRERTSNTAFANIACAMDQAEIYLNIQQLLTASRMCCDDLSETCLMIYVAQFLRVHPKPLDQYPLLDPDPYYASVISSNQRLFEDSSQTHPKVLDRPTTTSAYELHRTQSNIYTQHDHRLPRLGPVEDEYLLAGPTRETGPDFWSSIEDGQIYKQKLAQRTRGSGDLELGKRTIGTGQFADIHIARLTDPQGGGKIMAAKTIKDFDPRGAKQIMREAVTMQNFKHDNVMTLEAFVVVRGKPYIIMEHMDRGDLLDHVRKGKQVLPVDTLVHYTMQVACGLEHLADLRFVHRDVAARNCMINQKGLVKIGDFGFTRDILSDGIYQVLSGSQEALPVYWLAPEVYQDVSCLEFTTQSDVWAFAVLCYEVLTYGKVPYQGYRVDEIGLFLSAGKRLPRPADASVSMYNLMTDCWQADPARRPTFTEITYALKEQLGLNPDEQYATVYGDYLNRPTIPQIDQGTGAVLPTVGPAPPPRTSKGTDAARPPSSYRHSTKSGPLPATQPRL